MDRLESFCKKYIRAIDKLNILLEIISGVLFCLLVVLVFISVLSRFLANFSFAFIEQGAAYITVWMVMMGLPLVIRTGSMIAIEFLSDFFKGKVSHKILKTIVDVLNILFYIVVLGSGLMLIETGMLSVSPTLTWLRMSWVYLSFPLGAVFMLLNTVANILNYWERKEKAVC